MAMVSFFYSNSFGRDEVKKEYDKIIKKINSTYEKYCGELTELLVLLYEKLENVLRSEVETILKDYAALYPDCLATNYILQKNKFINTFDIKRTIPDSCFSSMKIKGTTISIALAKKKIEQVTFSCQKYFDSVFKSAKKDFLLEAEKCKAYYLKQLLEFQETIKRKLNSTKQKEQEILIIEQEILIFKKQIECLDELQNEIDRLITV
jgi:hypothetical protein